MKDVLAFLREVPFNYLPVLSVQLTITFREIHNMPFTLNVNGKTTTVDVPGDMPLLWVLRDVMNLKGTKFGCGIGQCGACTVHVRGRAQRACQTPVSAAAGAAITTIEGLSPTAPIRCSRHGRRSTCHSAATARPARS